MSIIYPDPDVYTRFLKVRQEEDKAVTDAQNFLAYLKRDICAYLGNEPGISVDIRDCSYTFGSDFPLAFTLDIVFRIDGMPVRTYSMKFSSSSKGSGPWTLLSDDLPGESLTISSVGRGPNYPVYKKILDHFEQHFGRGSLSFSLPKQS